MPGKKKPFIDKNRSVTFRLVHRSQKDPFIANPEAGEHVLAPLPHRSNDDSASTSFLKQKEEQVKYGVYFDDDYDYLQHLRDVNEIVQLVPMDDELSVFRASGRENKEEHKLRLPASLFECQDVELKVGLINQAAPAPGPHPEIDPDIAAILDDEENDVEFEELEDDFISKANAPIGDENHETIQKDGYDSDDHMNGSFEEECGSMHEDMKSRFTEYSLSSSVIPRSEGLQQLDARFEKIYEQYDDSEVGSLESEEDETESGQDDGYGGFIDLHSKRMLDMAEEFERQRHEKRNWFPLSETDDVGGITYCNDEDDVNVETLEKIYIQDKSDREDCETIISTYSNLYNHPTLIKEENIKKVRLDPKTGLPIESIHKGLSKQVLKKLPDDEKVTKESVKSTTSSYARMKDETPEERRLRKQTVKLERRERRNEKKANKLAFKDEELRTKQEEVNLRKNMHLLKLN